MGYPILSTPCSLWPFNTPPLPPGSFWSHCPHRIFNRGEMLTHTHTHSKDCIQTVQARTVKHQQIILIRVVSIGVLVSGSTKSLSMEWRARDSVSKVSDTVPARTSSLQIHQNSDRGRGIRRKNNSNKTRRSNVHRYFPCMYLKNKKSSYGILLW